MLFLKKKSFYSFLVQALLLLFQKLPVCSFTPSKQVSLKHTKLGLAENKEPGAKSEESKLFVDKEEEKAGLPLDIILSRSLDTVEDAIRLATRFPVEKGWIERPPMTEQEKCPALVVLGSGWAAHALLKIVDTTKTRLILISPSNHFVFTPSKTK